MTGMPGCRVRGFVIGERTPFGDVGPFEAIVEPHPYLLCSPCGDRLYQGHTMTGAAILSCNRCRVVVDVRRVA